MGELEYILSYLGEMPDYMGRIDLLKFELDRRIYHNGDYFKSPYSDRLSFRIQIKRKLRYYRYYMLSLLKKTRTDRDKILSNAYFTINDELSNLGYNCLCPPWWISINSELLFSPQYYQKSMNLCEKFETSSFFELLGSALYNEISSFIQFSESFYNSQDIRALIVPNDLTPFERISINVFKQIRKPSFIFLHGLPGRYNMLDEGRTDYLIVWGEKIKENYIKAGHNPDRILISGHPYYKKLSKNKIRYSFDNILIITQSISGAQHCDRVVLSDKGNILLYLYSIQRILLSLGVKSVRFRPHPSENSLWYLKYIDNAFFHLDKDPLNISLQKSSLVIGPTSTVLLEAIYAGVHYQIYEPLNGEYSLNNNKIVPPFDGSDKRIPVANDEDSLKLLLKEKFPIDLSCWSDYIQSPFDIRFMKKLI